MSFTQDGQATVMGESVVYKPTRASISGGTQLACPKAVMAGVAARSGWVGTGSPLPPPFLSQYDSWAVRLPPSNIELRGLLSDLIDDIPECVVIPDGAQLVIREIDRYLSSRPVQQNEAAREQPSETVIRVASMLDGQAILMIGGENRPHANRKLREAFRLSDLIWLKTSEQNPRLDCESEVSRSDVAVVLLAIRWSRHSFDDVKDLCEKHGKPLVRLPAGYNPNQVAEQILSQCSERLAAMRS